VRVRALVPQKPLVLAKSRLAEALDPPARAALTLRLLWRVCAVLRAAPGVEAVSIMTPDATVRASAAGWGMAACLDPGRDLNTALAAVIGAASRAARGPGMLIVAADLPWLEVADVAALLAPARPGVLVLAPSRDGAGTNALVCPPGVRFRPAYGGGSRARHRDRARDAGLEVVEVRRPGLACDLDTPEDLAMLRARGAAL